MSQLERRAPPFARVGDKLLVVGARQLADVREAARHVEGGHVVRPVQRPHQRAGECGGLARRHGLDRRLAGRVTLGRDKRPAVGLGVRLRRALLQRGDAAQRDREREGPAVDERVLRRAEDAQEVRVERGVLPPAGRGGLRLRGRVRLAERVQRGAERDRAHADVVDRKLDLARRRRERGGLLRPVYGRRFVGGAPREQEGQREKKTPHLAFSSTGALDSTRW